MSRKLGRSGETRFANLVADYERGATCNDSNEDEHGWDHVVEFDNKPIAGLSADLQSTVPAVFVQTKTRAKRGDQKVAVKLSNALAFTRSNNPCFVVLVSAPAGENPTFHAVHWWEELMGRTLKRARELHRAGVGEEAFHRKELSFTLKPGDRRDAEELVGWIETTVRSLGRDYAAAKSRLRDTVGFGADQFSGTVHVGPLTSIEQLVDHQLGLTPSIPIAKIEFNQRRFGIDIPFPMPDVPATFASMVAHPVSPCEVRVRGPDGVAFTTGGDVLAPSIPGLPEEHRKYRVRTPIFDLFWKEQEFAKFRCSFDTATLRSPDELAKIARFIGWGGQGDLEIMVTIGDERLFGGTGQLDPQADAPAWRRLAAPLGTLAKLAATRKAGPPMISIEQVTQVPWLDLMYSVVESTETTLTAKLRRDVEVPSFDHGISFAVLSVGEWAFATLIRLPISANVRSDDELKITFGQAQLIETYAFELSDSKTFARLTSDYSRYAVRPGAFAIDNMLLHLAGEYEATAK